MSKKKSSLFLSVVVLVLASCRTVPLSEQEKKVKFAPPTRTVSLALNDSCRVVGALRVMGTDPVWRKTSVGLEANIVQLFPGSVTVVSSSTQSGGAMTTNSQTYAQAPFLRFWNCASIPDEIKEKVTESPDIGANYDD